jgi:hypothetical protein
MKTVCAVFSFLISASTVFAAGNTSVYSCVTGSTWGNGPSMTPLVFDHKTKEIDFGAYHGVVNRDQSRPAFISPNFIKYQNVRYPTASWTPPASISGKRSGGKIVHVIHTDLFVSRYADMGSSKVYAIQVYAYQDGSLEKSLFPCTLEK